METSCPHCNQQLPANDAVEYRYCPRCGAAIQSESDEPNQNNIYTIPPDLKDVPRNETIRHPQANESNTDMSQSPDRTQPPKLQFHTYRREIKPPADRPPPSYFRSDIVGSRPDSPKDSAKETDRGSKIFIVLILAVGTLVILAVGGYFILIY
jgi:hypothetical protein